MKAHEIVVGKTYAASPSAVARLLYEAGYELEESPTTPHPDKPREFERAAPNDLWQTDLFTFILKRQNRRVYLVAFMDDHSRFIVGYGLHASQSSALVLEVLRAAVSSYQAPREVLTDNGSQYVTWRGKSAFTRQCEKLGIHQIVATPRRPQTLGKIERFWGSLWRECVESAVFVDLEDARRRLGLFIDHYNFQRPHQGIEGLVPADRFFGAAPEMLRTLKHRVSANALELARHGVPKTPFYLTGNAGGQPFSVHAEGERVILRRGEGEREQQAILAGRDLATGEATVWRGVEGMTAQSTVDVLFGSFAERGAPLVAKTDNGSAFVAGETEGFLGAHGVEHLLSPPRTPGYNGGVEAHIRWMKQRTAWQALREGRQDRWTSADLEAARLVANAARAPKSLDPASKITPELRAAFRQSVASHKAQLWAERAQDPAAASKGQINTVNRNAITRALVAHGILEIRSRRVSLPIGSLF